MEKSGSQRAIALTGIVVASLLILMKLVPLVPGHFKAGEYVALALWGSLGLFLKRGKVSGSSETSESL